MGAREKFIQFDSIHMRFGDPAAQLPYVLENVSLTIGRNEFVSIVGRSGCGKTTLLNIAAGLVAPTAGEIRIGGKRVDGPGQGQGVVFQQHALFPWLTALGNVQFGGRNAPISKTEKKQRALQLLELVGLGDAADRYPGELSGGMQQRVAIARALALDPDILLMDEPFGALDELTRIDLQGELLRVWEAQKKTVIFITHSINEALILSDRVILLSSHPGRIHMDLEIDLPRPRVRTDPKFNAVYQKIWDGLSS